MSETAGLAQICAGCGAEVEHTRHGWGRKRDLGEEGTAWDYCCRVLYDTSGDEYRVLNADYHYVDGETQRHFQAQPDGGQRRL